MAGRSGRIRIPEVTPASKLAPQLWAERDANRSKPSGINKNKNPVITLQEQKSGRDQDGSTVDQCLVSLNVNKEADEFRAWLGHKLPSEVRKQREQAVKSANKAAKKEAACWLELE
tara:strand:- start:1984 stop:2331 length:348 start_codon:yes stop_codon:yes gene_type:complete